MKTLDPDSPALPMGIPASKPDHNAYSQNGLTARQHFAGLAMQGILATVDRDDTAAEVARLAVECADALISELNKPTP